MLSQIFDDENVGMRLRKQCLPAAYAAKSGGRQPSRKVFVPDAIPGIPERFEERPHGAGLIDALGCQAIVWGPLQNDGDTRRTFDSALSARDGRRLRSFDVHMQQIDP